MRHPPFFPEQQQLFVYCESPYILDWEKGNSSSSRGGRELNQFEATLPLLPLLVISLLYIRDTHRCWSGVLLTTEAAAAAQRLLNLE